MKPHRDKIKRVLPGLLIGLFIFLALAADRAPAKKFLFSTETKGIWSLFRLESLDFRAPLPDAVVAYPFQSLPYMLSLKTVHSFVPDRLFALRLVSVLSAVFSLVFIYLIARILISRSAAIVALFFLVTGSAYLETSRAFGYVPLSHSASLLAILFAVIAWDRNDRGLWAALSGAAGYLLLYFYAPMRITAIPLIILIYLSSGRGRWRRLLLFGGVFVGLLVGIGLFQRGHSGLILRILQFGRWDEYTGHGTTPFILSQFVTHLRVHIPVMLGYLFNLNRIPFVTQWTPGAEYSRLFHTAFIPFWVTGLAVCGLRRKRGDIIVLLMMTWFILSRLPAHGIWPRRVIDILYPLSLLVGVGVTFIYSCLVRVLSGRNRRIWAGVVLGIFLLSVGFSEARYFLFELAPPSPNVSAETLSEIGDFLSDRLETNHMVAFPYYCHSFVVGNKYLINRLKGDEIVRSVNTIGPPPQFPSISEMLNRYMVASVVTDKSLTFIHCAPVSKDFYPALNWADEYFPESLSRTEIAGGLFEVFTFTPPDSVSANLIASENPAVRLSGGPIPAPAAFGREELVFDYWPRVFFDVEIWPSREGDPPWIVFDFGDDNRKILRGILASPPGDHNASRPDRFIRQAVVSAGTDGENWEELRRIRGDLVSGLPRKAYQWAIPGDRPFRYYRLEFFDDDNRPANSVTLRNLWLLESEDHRVGQFYQTEVIGGD